MCCDIDGYIDAYVAEIEEKEQLKEDQKRLRIWEKDMKDKFHANLDDTYGDALEELIDKYPNMTVDDICLVGDFFEIFKVKILK